MNFRTGLLVGFAFEGAEPASTTTGSTTQSEVVEFFILDSLGKNQISEQVMVLIDGKMVGTLNVNKDFPEAVLRATVPKPGTYSYTAEAQSVFNDQGKTFTYTGAGQGNISVASGKKFSLAGNFSGDTWLISLQEVEDSTVASQQPTSALGWYEEANRLYGAGRYKEAIYAYDQVIGSNDTSRDICIACSWAKRGHSLELLEDYEHASLSYQQALSLNPDIDWVKENLAKRNYSGLKNHNNLGVSENSRVEFEYVTGRKGC
jgi:hypothetical protein